MLAYINVLTERQSTMMVAIQKLNVAALGGRREDNSEPDWEPKVNDEVREFEIFCKNMCHMIRLREKFVSIKWLLSMLSLIFILKRLK